MSERSHSRVLTGTILIILGLALFALKRGQEFGEIITFILVGGLFLAGYFYRRLYGLLIPACILLGLAVGSVLENWIHAPINLDTLGLALGFFAIYLIDRTYRGRSHWWPLIPGVILAFRSLILENRTLEHLFKVGWPLIIVLIGILLMLGGFKKKA